MATALATAAAIGLTGMQAIAATPGPPAGTFGIYIESITPTIVTPHSTMRLSGYVVNTGSTDLTDVKVSLTASRERVATRFQLGRLAEGKSRTGTAISGARASIGDVAPGARAAWSFDVDADTLRLRDFGVYPLAVEVQGRDGGGAASGRLQTFVPWIPSERGFKPTRIAWLWPLAGTPGDTAGLSEALDGGRLDRLLAAARPATTPPVTFVVDPALLADVDALASSGDTGATAWLDALRARARGSDVLALPYADPDIVALVRAGLDSEIGLADQTGIGLADDILHTTTLRGIAVPPGGFADQRTLDSLATFERTIVLRGDALPPSNSRAITGARADVRTASGSMRAVLTDPTLNDLLSGAATQPGGPAAVEQRFLAETLLVTEQRPGAGSTIVVAPPTRWDPPPGLAAALLSDTANVPWLQPVTLADVVAEPPDGVARAALDYPQAARDAELPASALAHVPQIRSSLADFSAILATSAPGSWLAASSDALLTTESVSLRDNLPLAQKLRNDLTADVRAHLGKVHIASVGHITLTSNSQQIPVTVVNDLDVPVRVGVHLSTRNPTLLRSKSPAAVTVGAHRRATVQVDVQAGRGGRMQVNAQLQTDDDPPRPYGDPVTFRLDVTAYGTVALVVTASAAGLLFAAAGVRLTRRVVSAQRGRHAGTRS